MAVILAVCGHIHAEDNADDVYWTGDRDMENLYFSGPDILLTDKEVQAIQIAEAWNRGEEITCNPVVGPDGSIEFLFGAERPSIVCAVMQLTDIELQAGEKLLSVNLGDSVRWLVEPALSGEDTTHILLRPRQVGLDTAMIVTTDRRTYHLRLRSHRSEYMPRVRFSYMEDSLAKWELLKNRSAAQRKVDTIPETNEYLGDLYFGYSILGKAPWKPVRVYDDSVKTIIEMPDRMKQTEMPVFRVVRKNHRLFGKAEKVIVNLRAQGNRFIVDAIFDEGELVTGVGRNQIRVVIKRKPKAGESW